MFYDNKNTQGFNIMANLITILSLLAGLLSGYLFYNNNYILGSTFFVISGVLDILDGYTARRTGKITRFGSLLDWTVDKIVDGVVMGVLFVRHLDIFLGVVFTNVVVIHSIIKALFYLEFGKRDEHTKKFSSDIERIGIFRRYMLFVIIPVAVTIQTFTGVGISESLLIIGFMALISLLQRIYYIYRFENDEAKS